MPKKRQPGNPFHGIQRWYLRGLNVVVEVITESLDVRNVVVAALGGQVSRKQDYILSQSYHWTSRAVDISHQKSRN